LRRIPTRSEVFDASLQALECEIRFLLTPGDLLMIDNRRLLHGRTGFKPAEAEGPPYLQGCCSAGPRSR